MHYQRNTSKWVKSVLRWGNLAQRLASRDLEGLPPGRGRTAGELTRWYEGVNGYLRFVFASRPNYVRVDVDDEMSLARLARFCGREGHKFSRERRQRQPQREAVATYRPAAYEYTSLSACSSERLQQPQQRAARQATRRCKKRNPAGGGPVLARQELLVGLSCSWSVCCVYAVCRNTHSEQ